MQATFTSTSYEFQAESLSDSSEFVWIQTKVYWSNKGLGAKKAKKEASWSHTFVCLHERDAETVPTDYGLMTANGLGKAKLHLFESSTAMEIHLAVLAQFP